MTPEETLGVGIGAGSLFGMILFMVVPVILGIGSVALVIAALVDAIRVPNDRSYRAGTKVVWVLVILLGGFMGAIIYYAVGRPRRR